ncbi:MAG: PAS domain S-box protein, partial [Candidatus Delongbacteria bacterium]
MSGLSHIICYSVNFLLIGLLVWLLVRKKKFKNKENEELFRILLKNVPLPIFYKSSDGKYLGCNEEFEKFIGRTESEIVGKTVYNLSPEEIADKYFEKDKQLFESGESQIYEWKAV